MVQTLPGRLPARPGEPRGSPQGSRIGTARTTRVRARAPSPHAGRPGPLSVQTAAPADARAPIGAPRPPPAVPEAPGPQLLGRDSPRPCASARSPARPAAPPGPWSRGRPPARRFMGRPGPGPGRRGQRDPAGPCELPAPRHHGTQGPACPPAYPPTCERRLSERTVPPDPVRGLERPDPSPEGPRPCLLGVRRPEGGAVARQGGEIPGVGGAGAKGRALAARGRRGALLCARTAPPRGW